MTTWPFYGWPSPSRLYELLEGNADDLNYIADKDADDDEDDCIRSKILSIEGVNLTKWSLHAGGQFVIGLVDEEDADVFCCLLLTFVRS